MKYPRAILLAALLTPAFALAQQTDSPPNPENQARQMQAAESDSAGPDKQRGGDPTEAMSEESEQTNPQGDQPGVVGSDQQRGGNPTGVMSDESEKSGCSEVEQAQDSSCK